MFYAALEIHKHVIQAAVLDPQSGEIAEQRFGANGAELAAWAHKWHERVAAVAIEATSGWRWICRELQAAGLQVRLCDPGQALALKGRKRRAKTDRLDARWMALLLAKEMLPHAWLPPQDIQRLRDQTRLRQALRHDRTRWAQRLHAVLAHEGWPCARSKLLTRHGRRWAASLQVDAHVRAQIDAHLRIIGVLEEEMATIERELRRVARTDPRALRCRRSMASGRSWPASCSPRSATPSASVAPAKWFASPAWIPWSTNPPSSSAAASSPSKAPPTCDGHSCRPPNTPPGAPPARPPAARARRPPARRTDHRPQDRPPRLPRPHRTRPRRLTPNPTRPA